MSQVDWVGGVSAGPGKPFKDLPNMRASTAETKAELVLELHRLCRKTPKADAIASINRTREFVAVQAAAQRVAASKKSTVPQLQSAITSMLKWVA